MARVTEVVVWWAVLVAVWMFTLSSVSIQETVVSVIAGLPCALTATAARTAYGREWRPRLRWFRALVLLPGAIIQDTARVLTRPSSLGTRRAVPVSSDEAHRALATVAVSATPGTVVLDDSPEHAELLVHALVPGGSRLERSVRQ